MGAAGCRFGRNVPLQHTFPDTPNLLVPSPRHVSRELMTRDQFQPATILNLLAASWIQFMVHDWFVHDRSKTERIDIPIGAGDDWGAPSMQVPRSVPDTAPAGSTRPPAYANLNSHWWDSSQIYGCGDDMAAKLRTHSAGKLRIEPTGLLPIDPDTGVQFAGFSDNWWIGLAMLHTLFTLEHNYICDLLAHDHPDWNDDQLFRKAKLINAAVMAKIHTVEWTPAILPHPIIKLAMNVNWSGLVGEDRQELAELVDDQRTARRHRRLGGRSSRRAVFADRGVRRGLSHASADAGRLRVPLVRDRPAAREARSQRNRRPPHAGDRRTADDAGPVLLVRHVPPGRGHAAQLSAAPPEPHPRRRRAPRSGGGGHPAETASAACRATTSSAVC